VQPAFAQSSRGRAAWFEDPAAHTNAAEMVEVARRGPVPVATEENLSIKQQLAGLLKRDCDSIFATGAGEFGRSVGGLRNR
jgi:L-alanine-DL-glutamate epimerase-like enolase superfamily enzyme